MTREGAARFSFLLSAPIILGAALVKMPKVIANPSIIDASFLTGMAVSCISGLARHRLFVALCADENVPAVCAVSLPAGSGDYCCCLFQIHGINKCWFKSLI